MALATVSQKVLDSVFARLSNVNTGFNAGIVNEAPVYGLPNFIALDWSTQSSNFFFGQLDSASIEATGILQYPCACLYILESGQTNEQRFTQFSGLIRCIFDVFLSWTQMKVLQNFEAYANCVEDVVFDVINRLENQNWGKPLVYNGQIQAKRGPVQFGAQNFRQRLGFSMMFGIHQ